MCGFVVLMKNKATIDDVTFIEKALETIRHRGPHHKKVYFSSQVILGVNHLGIVDVKEGMQPFHSSDNKLHLVFNGEIYNFLELRYQLEKLGISFETSCEAEVILKLYELLGTDFIKQLRGMFSLVIYDQKLQQLIAIRDRFGIKPLYYTVFEEGIFLTSELKVFKSLTNQESDLNFNELQHYFTFGYVPEPSTCLTKVKTLNPGTYLTYSLKDGVSIQNYATFELLPTKTNSYVLKEKLQQAVIKSVEAHLQSDVEVGCFLSGGLDSTIIATCATAFKETVKAFTIGFNEVGYNEIPNAYQTADVLKLDLTTKILTAAEFMSDAKQTISYLDSPIVDPTCVMVYSLAKEAKKQVKVILSGEGADELFGGYPHYRDIKSQKLFNHLPASMRQLLLGINSCLPRSKVKTLIQYGCLPLEEHYVGAQTIFSEKEKEKLLSFYQKDQSFKTITTPIFNQYSHLDSLSQMQMVDLKLGLCSNQLVTSDRLSMAHALELRVPFLDSQVVALAKDLTFKEKIEGCQTKVLLKEAFEDVIPYHVLKTSPKRYTPPLKQWLKKELFDEIRDILLSPSCEHLINQKLALSYLESHAKGIGEHTQKIWAIVTFILWYESWMNEREE